MGNTWTASTFQPPISFFLTREGDDEKAGAIAWHHGISRKNGIIFEFIDNTESLQQLVFFSGQSSD